MRYTKYHKTAEVVRLPRAMLAGGAAALVLVASFLTLTAAPPSTRKALPDFSMPSAVQLARAPAATDDKPLRLVYRNSVVPGGVHSAEELAAVIKRDPIAAAHYANFNVAAAHLIRVEQSRMVHVSYRIGNQIYWTKNKVRLALGEYLLSDGEHLIRARCGNRIADVATGPVLPNEPAPEVLETAFVSADDLIDQTVSMAALNVMPAMPGAADNAASSVPATALASRAFAFDPVSPPGLFGMPTLPGVTVVGGRSAPALLVDGVVDTTPAAPVTDSPAKPVTDSPATPATPASPAAPAKPATGSDQIAQPATPSAPVIPVVDSPANDPAPGDIKTDAPKPARPEAPFIEPPVFTPAPPIATLPAVKVNLPEPDGAALAGLALAVLLTMRLRRR